MTEEQRLEQVRAVRWLIQHGFTQAGEGKVMYVKATGQQVRVKPSNEAQLRADLQRRFNEIFPGFQFILPTAAETMYRWSPAGIAEAEERKSLEA